PDVAAVATAGRVDDGCGDRYSAHEDWVRDDRPVAVVTKYNIRTSDENLYRNAGPRVHNSANLPTAKKSISHTTGICHELAAFTDRQFEKRAEVEAMPNVEGVIAVIRLEIVIVGRGVRFVGPAAVSDVVGPCVLGAQSEPAREAAAQCGLQRIIMRISAAGLVVDLRVAVSELTGHDGRARRRVRRYADDFIGNTPQEKVP